MEGFPHEDYIFLFRGVCFSIFSVLGISPPFIVLIGGSIVLFAVLLQFLNNFFPKKEAK